MQEEPQTKTDIELAHEWEKEQRLNDEMEEIFGPTSELDDDEDDTLDEYELHRQEHEHESRFDRVAD